MRNGKLWPRSLQLPALAGLAAMLCGCATDGKLTGAPPLAVKVPIACELVLKAAPLPKISADDDARAAFVKDDAALIRANGTIVRGRACLRRQRELYAGARRK